MTHHDHATQRDGGDTRQNILEKAELHFAAVGYAAARLEDVAADVGIRRPSLLYHFPTKQALYDEVEAGIFTAMHRAGQANITPHRDPLDRVIALLDAWLDFLVGRPSAARIIMRLTADSSIRQDDPVRFSNQILADMESVIKPGVAAGKLAPVPPIRFINAVASGILFHVCNSEQIGAERRYVPNDPREVEAFRSIVHKMAKVVLLV